MVNLATERAEPQVQGTRSTQTDESLVECTMDEYPVLHGDWLRHEATAPRVLSMFGSEDVMEMPAQDMAGHS